MAKRFPPALSKRVWPAGLHEFAPFNLDVGEQYLQIRNNVDDFRHSEGETPYTLRVTLQISLDGGATWVFVAGHGTRSRLVDEPYVDEDGNVETYAWSGGRNPALRQPENPNRQLRGFFTLSDQTNTGLEIVIDSAPILSPTTGL